MAATATAEKEPFFKLSKIPGANILIPLLLGCLLNTLFPDLFKTLGSFTLGMTQQGASPLVGAFLLIVGTTISFKSAPAAAARGAIIIIAKQVVVILVALLTLYAFNDNLFGLSAMVILAACTGANNAMYAGLMGDMGSEVERGAVAITTLVVRRSTKTLGLGRCGCCHLQLRRCQCRHAGRHGHGERGRLRRCRACHRYRAGCRVRHRDGHPDPARYCLGVQELQRQARYGRQRQGQGVSHSGTMLPPVACGSSPVAVFAAATGLFCCAHGRPMAEAPFRATFTWLPCLACDARAAFPAQLRIPALLLCCSRVAPA